MIDTNTFLAAPSVSTLLMALMLITVLYLARKPAHAVINRIMHLFYSSFRIGSRSILQAEKRLKERNREVLLELGREQAERQLQREFFRINKVVERDLGGYPALQRTIAEQINTIEESYAESGEIPAPSPDWVNAVEAIAKLKITAKSNLSSKVLDDIHKTAVHQQQEAVKEYRGSIKSRHEILQSMLPFWRKLSHTVDEVAATMNQLINRAKEIDVKMQRYEEISQGASVAERTLRASATTQFFIALFVVLIAVGGAVINFNLIALPMSEMVGASDRIGAFKVSDVAAMVIILVEVAMGLFLMEALRITRLFPIISAMDDKMRVRILWITFSILFTLACVESALAFMRDQIAADLHALRSSLTAVASNPSDIIATAQNPSMIPMLGQMVLGFILPFALTFVAIPLESLVHSSRTVIGDLMAMCLKSLAVLFRLTGNIFRELGKTLIHCYDIVIFAPLCVEGWVSGYIRHKNGVSRVEIGQQDCMDQPQKTGFSLADTLKM